MGWVWGNPLAVPAAERSRSRISCRETLPNNLRCIRATGGSVRF